MSEVVEVNDDAELEVECCLLRLPLLERDIPGLARSAPARSNTFPWNALAKEPFDGVLDIVACMAGPREAFCGVIGVGDRRSASLLAP